MSTDGPDHAAVAIVKVGSRELQVDLILQPGACVCLQPGSIAASELRLSSLQKVTPIFKMQLRLRAVFPFLCMHACTHTARMWDLPCLCSTSGARSILLHCATASHGAC